MVCRLEDGESGRLFAASRAALLGGTHQVQSVPADGDPRWGVSVMACATPTGPAADELADGFTAGLVAAGLRGIGRPADIKPELPEPGRGSAQSASSNRSAICSMSGRCSSQVALPMPSTKAAFPRTAKYSRVR
jgi:hypothetical protein